MMHRRFWPVFGWPAPPASGPYPAMPMEGFRTELRSLGEAYDCQTLRFVVDEVIAERDRVVLTVHNEGQYPDGEPYEMGYCFIFTSATARSSTPSSTPTPTTASPTARLAL